MRHDPGYGPYTNMQYRKYYRKAPIVITCPSLVCVGSSYTFSVTGATPHGYYWNTSSNLSMSGSGGSISVTGNANGAGWVSIMHSGV